MNAPRLIVVGAGGHARVVLDALARCGTPADGLLDADPGLHGTHLDGVPVIGGDEALSAYPPETARLVNALGSTHSTRARRAVYERLRQAGYRFAAVRHPAAAIAAGVEFGEGAQAMAGTVVQAGTSIGEDAIVNTGARIDRGCRIGAHVHVAPGATIAEEVTVGDESHVGTAAVVARGCRIGRRCLVAAGAVVLEDLPDEARVAGVPARRMRP